MSIVGRLLGKRNPEEARVAAETLLAEAGSMSGRDLKQAKVSIRKLDAVDLKPLIDFGAPLHLETTHLVHRFDEAVDGPSIGQLPKLSVYTEPCSEDYAGILASAKAAKADCTLVRFKSLLGHLPTIAPLEAQWLMGADASVAVITFYGYTLTRNGLLAVAKDALPAKYRPEDIHALLQAAVEQHVNLNEQEEWKSPLGYQMSVLRTN
jgi:hypothetical protein